jgi:hypothetical protein
MPQVLQVLGVVQVASFQECPSSLPFVSPQEHFETSVQVAFE